MIKKRLKIKITLSSYNDFVPLSNINSRKLKIQEKSIMSEIILRPDAKGKINLGDLAKNVSSYRVTKNTNGELTLTPFAEIPLSDKWLFDDKEKLEQFKKQMRHDEEA